jgi:hypothetical protein
MNRILALLPVLLMTLTPLSANETSNLAPGEMLNHATCTSGTDTREIEIIAKKSGFAVKYFRSGEAKEAGTCSSNQEKCQAIFDNIRENLVAAGFTCKT